MDTNLLKNTIRIGIVSSTNPANHTIRATFPDKDNLVSGDLAVVVSNTLKNKDYAMPDVNEYVVCLMLPNGLNAGFCLGAIYSDADKPANTNSNIRQTIFEDGTKIEYNRKNHELNIDVKGDINIVASGNIKINGAIINLN